MPPVEETLTPSESPVSPPRRAARLKQPTFFAWSLRLAVALVWLYQGLWAKLLAPAPNQIEVVRSALPPALPAEIVLTMIGAIETGLALWVLSGLRARLAALVQTALLVGMNGAGLVWSREHIADPAGMIVNNLAFLGLVWCVAEWSKNEKG